MKPPYKCKVTCLNGWGGGCGDVLVSLPDLHLSDDDSASFACPTCGATSYVVLTSEQRKRIIDASVEEFSGSIPKGMPAS